MRITLLAALLVATASCVHEPKPVVTPGGASTSRPRAAQTPPRAETPLDLPAAFSGVLPDTEGAELVLLDPQRFALVRQAGVLRELRHGSWHREGDRLLLADGKTRVFTVAEGGNRLLPELAQQGAQPTSVPGLRRQQLPRLLSGMVKRSGQDLMFTPCGGREASRLNDVTGAIGEELGRRTGAAFAEILGSQRDGELIAWDLQRLAFESQGCKQVKQGLVARALGNEPSWSLDIDKRSVRLQRPGKDPVGAPWAPFRWEGGAYRYRADTGTDQWDVSLSPRICRDTMAGNVFGYEARVRLNGEEVRGCAHLGTEWQLLDGTGER